MKILMVCLGNICRSPLAHGVLAHKLQGYDALVDSAGTAAYHVGNPPDPRSINVAKQHGIDISKQRARQFSVSDFNHFDKIYAMDRSNLNNLQALARDKRDLDKLSLFLDANPNATFTEVPDPYYGGEDGFNLVFNLVEDTCESIKQQLF